MTGTWDIRNRSSGHLLMPRSSSWMKDETTTKLISNLQPVLGVLMPHALMDTLWLKQSVRYWQAATKSPITEHRTSSDHNGHFQSHHSRCHCCCPVSCCLACRHKQQQETYPQTEGLGKWHSSSPRWILGGLTLLVPPNIPKLRVLPPSEVTLHVPIARVLVQYWVFGAPQTTLHWRLMDLPVDNEPIGKWAHAAILHLPASHNPRPGSRVGTRDHQSWWHEHPWRY